MTLLHAQPDCGPTGGGTVVVLTGSGWQPGVTVRFGTTAAAAVVRHSGFVLHATAPVLAAGVVDVTAINPDGGAARLASAFTARANALPVLAVPAGTTVTAAGETLRWSLGVTDAEGDRVTVRLLNPPPGCACVPLVGVAPPATLALRWLVAPADGGLHHLVFEVSDSATPPCRRRVVVPIRVEGPSVHRATLAGDVTGDGVLDVVAGARGADHEATDAGAVLVWAGGSPSGPPTATLRAASPAYGDALGVASGQGIQLADVTGDGVLDVVAACAGAGPADTGAVFVWHGGPGLAGPRAPDAVGTVPGAAPGDRWGAASGQGLQLVDVTGDGILDIVVAAADADGGGEGDVGAIAVFAGGPGLAGAVAPVARLSVPGAASGWRLGAASGQGVVLADVTGDGVADVLAGAPGATVAGAHAAGLIAVWHGGTALRGTPAPAVTLTVPGALAGDRLGDGVGRAIRCADLSGDGVADVVAAAPSAGGGDTGAVYVWRGGAALATTPWATLRDSAAGLGDRLATATGEGFVLADVTGDGLLDVVAGAPGADAGGVPDAGAVHVWPGGASLAGTPAPRTLAVPGAKPGDRMGSAAGRGIICVDLTGDGVADVVAGAPDAYVGWPQRFGAVYVWAPGRSVGGAPLATLVDGLATIGPWLGRAPGVALHAVDLDGDGVDDLVAAAAAAMVGTANDAGAVYGWRGGAALVGTRWADVVLRDPAALAFDRIGGGTTSQGVFLADVTGDGRPEILAAAPDAGGADEGRVLVWSAPFTGGATPAPLASLRDPLGRPGDRLAATAGTGVQFADLDGDGVLDVVVACAGADAAAARDAGVVLAWLGGAMAATPAPAWRFAATTMADADRLTDAAGEGLVLADLDGDGAPELLAAAPSTDLGMVGDAGALWWWPAPPGPPIRLAASSPRFGDRLGE